MLIVNNKALKITNKWLNPVAGSGPTPPGPTPTYYHVYTSATNGTITAAPVSGISGTTVTLSNTPDEGYVFDSYSLTGATLYDTNKFDINNSDVNVVGNFIAAPEPVYIDPVYITEDQRYARWEKSQFNNAGGNYNSTYRIVSDNWSSVPSRFYYVGYDSSWNTVIDSRLTDTYVFSFNDISSETQYNNLNLLLISASTGSQDIQLPSDIKLQLLS